MTSKNASRRETNTLDESRWASHRFAAFAIRTAVRLVPVGVAIGTGFVGARLLPRSLTAHIWPGQTILVVTSITAAFLAERVARRALPLAVLLQLTLLFPDRAPSRWKVARKGGKAALAQQNSKDPQTAAGQLLGLLAALSSHDRRTRGHSERVRLYADMLGAELELPRADLDRLRWAALLHDIGKLEIDPAILNKPSKPSEREWRILRAHPERGAVLAAPLLGWLGEWGLAIEQHHEYYDGTGYPHGLSGENISRAGRLMAVVDAYEVMTAPRTYKRPMNTRAAREELTRCAGTQFDPHLVRAFLAVSLPRLLWTTGPFAFAGQLPLLRGLSQIAQQVPTAAAATATASLVGTGLAATPHAPLQQPATKAPFTSSAEGNMAPAHTPGPEPLRQSVARTQPAPLPATLPTEPPTLTPSSPPPSEATTPVVTLTSQLPLMLIGPATMTWTVNDPTTTTICSLDGAQQRCRGTYTATGASPPTTP